jgi:hypothetical protein
MAWLPRSVTSVVLGLLQVLYACASYQFVMIGVNTFAISSLKTNTNIKSNDIVGLYKISLSSSNKEPSPSDVAVVTELLL